MADFDVQALRDAWNAHAVERIAGFYADDAQVKALPNPEPYVGPRGVEESIRNTLQAVPDMNCDVLWSIQRGDKVCALVRITGRHAGPLTLSDSQIIPATDRKIDIHLGAFLELDHDGRIRRETRISDAAGMLMQIGKLGPELAGSSGQPARR